MGAGRRPRTVAAISATVLAAAIVLAGCDEDETSFSNNEIVEALKLEETDGAYAIGGDPFCEVSEKLLNDASEVDDASDTEQLVLSSAEGNVGIEVVAPFACEREAKNGLNKLDPPTSDE
jgi:hypothetical protein